MEMTNKELDKYVHIDDGKYKGSMYKINSAYFKKVDGKNVLFFDYDVLNLEKGKEQEFDEWIGEQAVQSLQYAIENDPMDGNGI